MDPRAYISDENTSGHTWRRYKYMDDDVLKK